MEEPSERHLHYTDPMAVRQRIFLPPLDLASRHGYSISMPSTSTTQPKADDLPQTSLVRPATMADVPSIHQLVSYHAELGRMLFRSLTNLYEHLRDFLVAERDGRVVGCAAVELTWRNLAEIKSLAVEEACRGQGIGRHLVDASLDEARRLRLDRVFALTRERAFFEKAGFREVEKDSLPHKVWTDCVRCPIQANCDEVAVVFDLSD
jgi:amino-acid N-acetyltransferase